MPLIMGILAQAAAAPGPTPGAAAYDLLETEILTGTTASVTFSSLNSTYGADYQHLQIRYVIRNDNSNPYSESSLQFNSEGSPNYARHAIIGNGSSITVGGVANDGPIMLYTGSAGNTATANSFGAGVVDILDAFETTKYKTIRNLAGRIVGGGEDRVALSSGVWKNTAAVTTLTLDQVIGSNFLTGSRFSLYGLKAA